MTTLHLISLISSFLMILLAAASKAIMDICASTFASSRLRRLNPLFWDKSQSWRNKWKNGDPQQGERFLGSSTVFVSFTDAWHLFQHFFLMPLALLPIVYSQCYPIVAWDYWMVTDFTIIYIAFTVSFQIVYWMLNRK